MSGMRRISGVWVIVPRQVRSATMLTRGLKWRFIHTDSNLYKNSFINRFFSFSITPPLLQRTYCSLVASITTTCIICCSCIVVTCNSFIVCFLFCVLCYHIILNSIFYFPLLYDRALATFQLKATWRINTLRGMGSSWSLKNCQLDKPGWINTPIRMRNELWIKIKKKRLTSAPQLPRSYKIMASYSHTRTTGPHALLYPAWLLRRIKTW